VHLLTTSLKTNSGDPHFLGRRNPRYQPAYARNLMLPERMRKPTIWEPLRILR